MGAPQENERAPPRSLQPSIKEGDLVGGKYRVERLIGVGGMAAVFAATHERLDQRVAIKILLPEAMHHAGIVERFAREARAVARLRSEHVTRIIDVDVLPDKAPYIVMELLEGTDLRELLTNGGPLPIADAVDYVMQACDGIAEAHAAGIVHRDLKPANLFLADRAGGATTVKVLDFGVAKNEADSMSEQPGFELTRTFDVVGSPHYLSPEQIAHAKKVDARADIWALGVCLYRLLCDKPPFDGESFPQLCMAILQSEPTPLDEHRPEIPAELAAVVARCLAKEPKDRFPSAAQLIEALRPFAPVEGSARPPVARVASTAASIEPKENLSRSTAPWRGLVTEARRADGAGRKRAAIAIAACALVVATIVVVAGASARRRVSPAVTPAATQAAESAQTAALASAPAAVRTADPPPAATALAAAAPDAPKAAAPAPVAVTPAPRPKRAPPTSPSSAAPAITAAARVAPPPAPKAARNPLDMELKDP